MDFDPFKIHFTPQPIRGGGGARRMARKFVKWIYPCLLLLNFFREIVTFGKFSQKLLVTKSKCSDNGLNWKTLRMMHGFDCKVVQTLDQLRNTVNHEIKSYLVIEYWQYIVKLSHKPMLGILSLLLSKSVNKSVKKIFLKIRQNFFKKSAKNLLNLSKNISKTLSTNMS